MPLIIIPPEKVAEARHLYEGTAVPVHDVAMFLGISAQTLHRRIRKWKWRRRNRRLAELDAAAMAEIPLGEIRAVAEAPVAVLQHVSLIDRVRSAIEREIVAIENVLSRVDGVRLRSQDAERAARTLATLVRTLRHVNDLKEAGVDDGSKEREDQFRDLDEFRRELSARLARVRAAGDSA